MSDLERIPSGRGDNGTLLFTDDQEIGSRDERAGQRALHTRFGHGSTFLFSPVAAAANSTFTASWSSSPRVSRRRMGRARGGEGGRGTRRGEAIPEVDSRGRAPFDTGNERKCQIRGSRGEPRLRSKSRNDGDDDSNPSPPPFFFSFSSSSSIIVPCLARGESFDDDLDDLDEDEV